MKDPRSLCLSASSLDVFARCPRLFAYRYLDEEKLYFSLTDRGRQGNQFHRLVEILTPLSPSEREPWLDRVEPQIKEWWENFCRSGLDQIEGKFFSELPILVEYKNWQLQARYDRLVIHNNHYQIWDWKTGKERSTWQTRLYPLLLHLHHQVEPSLISVHFWYTSKGEIPFVYSNSQKEEDEIILDQTLERIGSLDFPQTTNPKVCTDCFFRYHCWGR